MTTINKLTLVQLAVDPADNLPQYIAWAPGTSEQPAITTGWKAYGVAATDATDEQRLAVMTYGYLRACPAQNGETWAVGETLWAKADGTATHTRPDAPLPQICLGTVFEDEGGGNFAVDVFVRAIPSLGELSGVSRETPVDKDVFIYDNANEYWEPRQLVHNEDLDGLDTGSAHPASAVDYTPSGDLISTNVQDAIDELASPRIDDLRFPAQGINPAGSPAPPGVDTATGCLSFAGNLDNVIAGVAQMPHSWNPGSAVSPHLHLRFPTSNAGKNTRWKFEYDIANIGEDFTNNSGTFSALTVITVANPANVKRHVIAYFEDLDMTGYTESSVILWKVSRLASSDGADDDTNACFLLEFDIHFEVIKRGTIEGT